MIRPKSKTRDLMEEIQSFLEFVKNNKLICFAAAFISLFSFWFPLTHFTLSIDEEVAFVLGDQYNWSSQGRFGISLLKTIFHYWNTNSVTSTLLAVMFMFFSSIIWVYGFSSISGPEKNKRYTPGIILVIVFLSFPVHSENIGFSMMSVEVGVGWMITSVASVLISKWAIYKKSTTFLWLGICLVSLATSIYQGFLPAFISGIIANLLLYLLSKSAEQVSYSKYFSYVVRFIFVSASSFILYKIIDKLIQVSNPSLGYLDDFVAWGSKPVADIVKDLLGYFKSLFLGKVVYGVEIILPSLLACLIIILAYVAKWVGSKKEINNAGVIVFTLIGLILTPFLLYVLLGSPVPIRGNLVWALFTSSICMLVFILIKRTVFRNIVMLVIFLVSFYQANAINQLFFSDYLRYQEDVNLAHQIGYKIMDLNLGEIPPFPVVYVGNHMQKESKSIIKNEVLGYSFFEWDGGSQLRISGFMEALGYRYMAPNDEQKLKAQQIAKNMPGWPYEGSVRAEDNIIVVNLSNSNSKQHALSLTSNKEAIESKITQTTSIEIENGESSDANVAAIEGGVKISSGVVDPYVTFSVSSYKEDFNYIEIELDSDIEGELQMFLLPLNGQYSEDFSGTIRVSRGKNVIFCQKPNSFEITDIRIDPPNQSQLIIKEISLVKTK